MYIVFLGSQVNKKQYHYFLKDGHYMLNAWWKTWHIYTSKIIEERYELGKLLVMIFLMVNKGNEELHPTQLACRFI